MDGYIRRAVRLIWRNKLASTIGISIMLAWITPDVLRHIIGTVFDTIMLAIASLLSIIAGEASRHSTSIGHLILIGVCICVIKNMWTSLFGKKKKKK